MSATQTVLEQVTACIKKTCEDAFQRALTSFLLHIGQTPSSEFTISGTDLRLAEYIRDRFLQEGIVASISTDKETMCHTVTISAQKHLPELPCTCGCKSLSGHVEVVETPIMTEEAVPEPIQNSSTEVRFISYNLTRDSHSLPPILSELGYRMETTENLSRAGKFLNYRVRLFRDHPIVLPRDGRKFSFSNLGYEGRIFLVEFLRAEGFQNVYIELGIAYATVFFEFPTME